MGDGEQMWVTVVPALENGEDDAAELVVIAVDPASSDPGRRVMDTPGPGPRGRGGSGMMTTL